MLLTADRAYNTALLLLLKLVPPDELNDLPNLASVMRFK